MPSPEQTTIQAKWVNPIAPGKKFGSIVDSVDQKWMCNDEKLVGKGTKDNHTNGSIAKGQTFTFSFTTQKWGNDTVNIIEEVLDAAPRTSGTEAPPMPVTDRECRIFVCGYAQNLYHGTGSFPGRDMLADILLDIRSAYEWAFSQPLRPINQVRKTVSEGVRAQMNIAPQRPQYDPMYDGPLPP